MTRPVPNLRVPRSAHRPCPTCGRLVLTGISTAGTTVSVETDGQAYVVSWTPGTPLPVLALSAAYPVHVCGPEGDGQAEGR